MWTLSLRCSPAACCNDGVNDLFGHSQDVQASWCAGEIRRFHRPTTAKWRRTRNSCRTKINLTLARMSALLAVRFDCSRGVS